MAQLNGANVSTNMQPALAKEDRLPIPVIRLGRRMVVSRAAIDQLLGTGQSQPAAAQREQA